ncbi:GlsB/YeaQ/YmgE family stress response membrane protein [Dinghuibacter silviterrae]|nr:GlsB/YeaQ/YmgE family stress response membrane protein [Dinghuibacter silviterrae]
MRGEGFGILWDIVVGIIGGWVGGWIFGLIGLHAGGTFGSFIVAIIGAVILIWVIRMIKRA